MGFLVEEEVVKYNLQERLFDFTVKVIEGIREFPKGKEYDVITFQLVKSASSAGANYNEASAAVSKLDFANKVGISLKEMRETNYWIKIVIAINPENKLWQVLQNESNQLMLILGKIYSKTSVHR